MANRKKSVPGRKKQTVQRKKGQNPLDSMTNWLLVLIAVLPIIFTSLTLEPVIPVRFIFMSGFTLAFIAYFFGVKRIPVRLDWVPMTKWFFGLALFIGFWSILSMIFSYNVTEGFYRISRWFLQLALLLCIVITVTRESDQLYKVCRLLVLMGILQGVVGIFQFHGIAFSSLPGQGPPYGLMANRNLFGSAQVLMLPFITWCFFTQKGVWKYLAVSAFPILIYSILISQTRSAWVGLIFFIIISQILFLSRRNRFDAGLQKGWIQGSLGVLAIIITVVVGGLLSPKGEIVKNRLSQLINAPTEIMSENTSANFRLKASKDCLAMMLDNPILGVGPGNWRLLVANYSTGDRANQTGQAIRIRPHNDFGELGAERGIPGLLAFLVMWVIIFWTGFQLLGILKDKPNQLLLIICLLSVLSAILVDMLVSFPNERIEHSLYYVLIWGIFLGLRQAAEKTPERQSFSWPIVAGLCFIPLFSLILGITKFNYQYHLNYANAYKKAAPNNPSYWDKVIEHAEKGKSPFQTIGPIGDPITMYEALGYKGKKQLDKAIETIKLAAKQHPNSARIYNTMGTIYTDQKNFPKAIESYQKALTIAPEYDVVFKNLAINYFNLGDYPKTIETIDTYKKYYPHRKGELTDEVYNQAKARLRQ